MNALLHEVPEKLGVSSRVLAELYEELEKNCLPLHSMIIMRHGKIATSGYWYPFTKEMNHIVYSTSKSITALAAGLCIEEGRFTLDDKLIDFFPDLITGPIHEFTGMRTVRHLLTMTDGQLGDPNNSIDRTYCDWFKSYLNSIPRVKPGTLYGYSNSATIALCAIIQRVTGMTMMEYLQPRLFDPMGISGIYCEEQMGINTGSRGIHCKTEDLAKIGQMMLQKGKWNGGQIVPEHWVEEATRKQAEVTNFSITTDGNPGYGYQWWLYRDGAIGTKGNGGQNIIYYPEYDLVWAFTANLEDNFGTHQEFMHMAWPFILRSLSDSALPDDPESYARLKDKERTLEFSIPNGLLSRSPAEDFFNGKKYIVARNEAQVNDFIIHKTDRGLKFSFSMYKERREWEFEAGFNEWIPQRIDVTDDDGWVRYLWRNENIMECIILLKNKLGSYRLVFYCDGAEMSLDFYSVGWRDFERFQSACMAYHW